MIKLLPFLMVVCCFFLGACNGFQADEHPNEAQLIQHDNLNQIQQVGIQGGQATFYTREEIAQMLPENVEQFTAEEIARLLPQGIFLSVDEIHQLVSEGAPGSKKPEPAYNQRFLSNTIN